MPTDPSKIFTDQIAQSVERIARYSQLVANASADPDNGAAQAVAAKALESERDHKLRMENMLAKEQKVLRRIAAMNLRARIVFVLAIAGVIAVLLLDHGARH
jgi:hypothetical protein